MDRQVIDSSLPSSTWERTVPRSCASPNEDALTGGAWAKHSFAEQGIPKWNLGTSSKLDCFQTGLLRSRAELEAQRNKAFPTWERVQKPKLDGQPMTCAVIE